MYCVVYIFSLDGLMWEKKQRYVCVTVLLTFYHSQRDCIIAMPEELIVWHRNDSKRILYAHYSKADEEEILCDWILVNVIFV